MILIPKLPFVVTVINDGWYGEAIAYLALIPKDHGGVLELSAARLSESHIQKAPNLTDKEKASILGLPEVADTSEMYTQLWEFWVKWLERQPLRIEFVYDNALHPGVLDFFRACVRADVAVRQDLDPMVKVDVASLLRVLGHDPRTSRFTIARMAGMEPGNLEHVALAIATCYADMQRLIEGTP